MIVAEQKPLEEILSAVAPYEKLLIAACGACVTVCLSGGEAEAKNLAEKLSLSGKSCEVRAPERQCDPEFLEALDEEISAADAVVSMACGAGVQFLAERRPRTPVLPGLNTSFIGVNRGLGYWTEMCRGCGNCVLEKTGGVCPIARCSKSHFNGPCGGSRAGKCETNPDIDCAWQLIFDRLTGLGQAACLYETLPPRDWSTDRDGGPRSMKRSDIRAEAGT